MLFRAEPVVRAACHDVSAGRGAAAWMRAEMFVVAGIIVAYGAVLPFGNYAVMDDWAYAKSLEHLHFDGELRILDWNPMSLVGHLFWGCAFTKLFGFSFDVMRLSVVTQAALECLAFARLLRLCGVDERTVCAAVATLLFNPLHLMHSFTYMTDIPAVAWEVISLTCFVSAIRSPSVSNRWLLLGSTFAGISFSVRQCGILPCAGFIVYALLWDRRLFSLRHLAAGLVPAALLVGAFEYWYYVVHGATSTFSASAARSVEMLVHPPLRDVPYLLFSFAMALGLFLAPLSLTLRWRSYGMPPGWPRIGFVAVAWLLVNVFLHYAVNESRLFPYTINVMSRFGFFSVNEFIVGDRDVLWGSVGAWAVSVCGMLSLLVFIARAFACARVAGRLATVGSPCRLLTAVLGLQFVYFYLTSPFLFDRHFLIMAPVALALFCSMLPPCAAPCAPLFVLAILPWAAYGIAATHDLHAIHRTAFAAGGDLIDEGIDSKHVDGGYAFDGWHMYERSRRGPSRHVMTTDGWWVPNLYPDIKPWYTISLSSSLQYERYRDRVAVVTGPDLAGYEVRRTYAFRSYWPWKLQPVYVMRSSACPEGTSRQRGERAK